MVFSGDTLFFGDIARTDFFGPQRKAEMAEKIYDSIAKKILPLGDGVILCPAHGAGSACGSEIADHPFSTLGYEKRTNPFLAIKKDAFVAQRTTESPYLPPYFRQMEMVNKNGPVLLNTLPRPQPIPVAAVAGMIASGCQIVDIRFPTAFAAGHIPGSLSLWRDGIAIVCPAGSWIMNVPIVLVDDFTCTIDTVLQYFVRMGYDNISGWLAGGFPAWFRAARPVAATGACTVQDLKERLTRETPFLLDVRDRKTGSMSGTSRVHSTYMSASSRSTCRRSRRTDPLSYTAIPGTRGALRQACSRCTVSLT